MSIKLTSPRSCSLHSTDEAGCEERLARVVRIRKNIEILTGVPSAQTMKIDVALSVILSESPSKLNLQ